MPFKNPEDRSVAQRKLRERLRLDPEFRERERERSRRYREQNKAAISERRKQRQNDPEVRVRHVARAKINRAVQHGWLERPAPELEFHHPDYQRPYFGCWLTHREHQRVHAGLAPCPPCEDFTDAVEAVRIPALRQGRRNAGLAMNRKRWGNRQEAT